MLEPILVLEWRAVEQSAGIGPSGLSSTRSRSYPTLIDSQERLRETSLSLIRSVFPPAKGIRLLGVTVSNFDLPSGLPLFGEA